MNFKLFLKLLGFFYVKFLWIHSFVGPLFLSSGFLAVTYGVQVNYPIVLLLGIMVTVAGALITGNGIFKVIETTKDAYINQTVNQVPYRYRWSAELAISIFLYVVVAFAGLFFIPEFYSMEILYKFAIEHGVKGSLVFLISWAMIDFKLAEIEKEK